MIDLSAPTSASRSSFPAQRWHIAPARPPEAAQIAQVAGLSPILGQVLLNRGIETPEAARSFLNPEKLVLPSPLEEFPDLAASVELLAEAIAQGRKIAICGDYDADGMTSTALLLRSLRQLGARVDYAIPSRMQEGYGINERIVEEFHQEGVGLVLTVDNGIAAVKPIARARELGLDVIITDHHDLPPELPPANAILNPKLLPTTSPYWGVAGVGVAYILAVSLAQQSGQLQDLVNPLLELFTLGTIADLAPLTGVNRRWVKRGLRLLPQSRIPGIQALIQVAGLAASDNQSLKPEDIGFRLGPRINAVGRIGDPQTVIEMLTTDEWEVALERATQCEHINQQRQQLCSEIEQEAIAWCETEGPDLSETRVLVVVQPDWHHGVIGIVASRLVERYGVPVFIGTYEDEERQHIRGSARSIPEFHVFEALEFAKDLLIKHGGHRAAGGFSLAAENLEALQARLSQFAHQCLEPEYLKPLVTVDAEAHLQDLTADLYAEVDALHPCGMENPDPVFWSEAVEVLEQRTVGKDQIHLKLTLRQRSPDGQAAMLQAIAWRWGCYYPLPSCLDVAYRLRENVWNGNTTIELELLGVRLPAERSLVSFVHGDRDYRCFLQRRSHQQWLTIENPDGSSLTIQQGQRIGRLRSPTGISKDVNVSQAQWYTLIKAAVQALQASP